MTFSKKLHCKANLDTLAIRLEQLKNNFLKSALNTNNPLIEHDQLSMRKKSKKQAMNKAVYWTVASKSKKLFLKNPDELKNLSSEIGKLENQTIQDL